MKRELITLSGLALALVLCGCSKEQAASPTDPPNMVSVTITLSPGTLTPESPPSSSPTPAPTPTPVPTQTIATIAVCGDTLVHNTILESARDGDAYDFTYLMEAARPYVEAADYAVVNLETTLPGGDEFTGYPRFRTPDALAADLKDLGFDLCLTANNHCMDAGFDGLCRTLDALDEAGLSHVGTSRTEEESENNIVVADVGGISVAFLGYTYGTNGLPLNQNAPWSVNLFNTDYMTTLSTPDTEKILSDLEKAKELDTDMIAVLMHWGVEYQTEQNSYQEELADLLIGNGADLIFGGHSHVLQPCQTRTVTDEDGTERTGFVCYSLGNFFSNQTKEYTDLTAVLTVELTRDSETGESAVTDWSYVPMIMVNWGKSAEQNERYQVLDIHKALDAGDSGINERLEEALENIHRILGEEHDERSNSDETDLQNQ